MLFLPELTLLGAGLLFFVFSLGAHSSDTIRNAAIALCAITLAATVVTVNATGELFFGAYRVDLFSQVFKVLIAFATLVVVISVISSQELSPNSWPNITSS